MACVPFSSLLNLFPMFTAQIAMLKNSCKLALKELKRWMAPEKVYVVRNSLLSRNLHFNMIFTRTFASLIQHLLLIVG